MTKDKDSKSAEGAAQAAPEEPAHGGDWFGLDAPAEANWFGTVEPAAEPKSAKTKEA